MLLQDKFANTCNGLTSYDNITYEYNFELQWTTLNGTKWKSKWCEWWDQSEEHQLQTYSVHSTKVWCPNYLYDAVLCAGVYCEDTEDMTRCVIMTVTSHSSLLSLDCTQPSNVNSIPAPVSSVYTSPVQRIHATVWQVTSDTECVVTRLHFYTHRTPSVECSVGCTLDISQGRDR